MAIKTSNVLVQQFASALYGMQLGSTTMNAVLADATRLSADGSNGLDRAFNAYYANSFGGMTNAAVANTVVANLGITGAAATEAAAYIANQLAAATPTTKGAVINKVLNIFSNATADATFGAAATAWNTTVANSVNYAASNAADTAVNTAIPTFTLTNGTDVATANVFTAGMVYTPGGNDRVNALQDEDRLTGSGTNPTLTATLGAANDGAGTTITPSLTGIETINAAFTNSAGTMTLDLQDATGVNAVNVTRISGGQNAIVANMTAATPRLSVSNSVDGVSSAAFSYTAAALSGSADAVNITLNGANLTNLNVGTGAAAAAAGAGVETLNITANTNASTLTGNLGTGATTITATGAVNLDLGTVTSANLRTFDASTMRGNVTANLIAGMNANALTATTGTGNDTIIVQTVGATDTVAMGTGTDTLRSQSNADIGEVAVNGATITGVESLVLRSLDDGVAGAADFTVTTSRVGGLERITVENRDANSNAVYTLNALSQAVANNITALSTLGQAADVTAALANNTGAADSVSVTYGAAGGTVNFNSTLTAAGVENVTLNIADNASHNVTLASVANHTGTVTLTGGAAGQTQTITGNLVAATVAAGTTASNMALTFGAGNTAVTTGSGDDTFTFGANFNNLDSINAGTGTDRLIITPAGNVGTAVSVTGVERLSVGATANSSINFTGTTGIVTLDATAGGAINGNTFTGVNLTGINTVNYATTVGNTTHNAVSLTGAYSGSADSLAVNINTAAVASTATGLLTTNGVETANIALSNGAAAAGTRDVVWGGMTSNTLQTVNVTSADMIVGTGINLGTFTGSGTANSITLFNASTILGNVTATVNSMADGGMVNMGSGNDVISVAGSAGVNINVNGGAGNDNITGSAQADVLNGDDGDDTINGGAGNDIINGGAGTNSITGGGGADAITFAAGSINTINYTSTVTAALTAEGGDTVTGFTAANGEINFASLAGLTGFVAGTAAVAGETLIASTSGLSNVNFVSNITGLSVTAQATFVYNTATGVLTFDADGTGGVAAAITIATLTGAPTISAADFVIA